MHYGSNNGMNALSYPMYKDFSEHNDVFTGMFCRYALDVSLGYGNRTERVPAELVSGTYFPVLGVTAAIGRTFGPDDDRIPNGHPLAVLSYSFWQNRFAGDPAIVNKTITLNGHNMTVIGVAQPGFDGVQLGHTSKVFIPVMMKAQMTPQWDAMKDRRWRWVNAFGRIKPGISEKQAQTALQPFFHSMLEMEVTEPAFRNASDFTRHEFLKSSIEVLPGSQGQSYLRQQLSTPLWVLMALTGTVLLLACANLANLMLARAAVVTAKWRCGCHRCRPSPHYSPVISGESAALDLGRYSRFDIGLRCRSILLPPIFPPMPPAISPSAPFQTCAFCFSLSR